MLVAGGFCYGMLLDESCIARESQNSPAPARASDRLLSICVHEKHRVPAPIQARSASERNPLPQHDFDLFSRLVPPAAGREREQAGRTGESQQIR